MAQDSPSPLAEASPKSLDELFSRDPLGLADQDIAVIVTELRRQRAQWVIAETQGKTRAPKSGPKAQADVALSLKDLGLE